MNLGQIGLGKFEVSGILCGPYRAGWGEGGDCLSQTLSNLDELLN